MGALLLDTAPQQASQDRQSVGSHRGGDFVACSCPRNRISPRRRSQAIEHTPTIVELYLVKARAQKVRSTVLGKLSLLTHAHTLPEGRRTTSCQRDRRLVPQLEVLSLLLARRQTEGSGRLHAAVYEGPPPATSAVVDCSLCAAIVEQEGDQTTNLFEMQCMWFELESGRRSVTSGAFSE